MKYKELEKHFENLLRAELKDIPSKELTLFDIAGFPHYETVLSNFYSYYFDPNGKHNFSELFLNALSEIIKSKTKGDSVITNIKNCYTETEVNTINGKFIDIVIYEPSEIYNEPENAIIIENKINASVYNDLMEYYNSTKVKNNKIGIVLSLLPEFNLPEKYINITHSELINQVEQSTGSYFLNADIKQIIILKEFILNIKSMTHTQDLKDQYEFFFKHQEKIKEINNLYSTIKTDIFKQVDDVCDSLKLGLTLQAKYHSQLRYFYSNSAPICFTVYLDDLFNGNGDLFIYVELKEDGVQSIDLINKIEFTEDEEKLLFENSKIRKTYIHYAM
ncbi:MAG: PD-(D/E)XK nuclease family protein, partial [Bacteroidia bacterium]